MSQITSTMMHGDLLISDILERANQYYGDQEIVSRMPDKSLHRHTYHDFYRRARQLASGLTALGLNKGDRVATLMWNHYAHLEAYFGIPVAGFTLHTLNLRLFPDDIAYIANHADDQVLIVDDVLLPLYEKFKDQVNFKKVYVVPLTGAPVPEGLESYEALLANAPDDFDYPDLQETDACGMCYTSGTTGRPKGVVYSHRSTVLHSLSCALPDALSLSAKDAITPVVPMFHVNAWGLPYTCVMTGSKHVYPGPHLGGEDLLDLYKREETTITAGVPTIWMDILTHLRADPERWSGLSGMRMVVGGSAAPEAMIRKFDQYGMHIIHAWGMTETSPLVTASVLNRQMQSAPEDEQYRIRSKQGFAAPFAKMRLMNDNGDIVPWDGQSMGEVQVSGPWITGAYFNMESSSDKFTEDGWLRTGDVATIDQHGYMTITDRTKDLVKSGGEWISSVELENAIMGHPAVAEAAVIALPHDKWDERPLACIVLKPGEEVTETEIIDMLRDQFAKFWLPDAVEFIDAIPRTSTGKFQKLKLREMYQDWTWS